MKKTLALLLTLCMLMVAIPVLAEEVVSGTWYMVMLGLTSGIFELNEDGTCVVTTVSNTEKEALEGTWTQEEDKITINVKDEPLVLVRDGDNLTFNAEDLSTLGMDQSSVTGPGIDMSLFSNMIQITREPGKITVEELNAYQDNGTLPEGKTKEDMEAIQTELQSSIVALFEGMVGTTEETPGPELTILEDNFYVREGYGSQEGVYFAKVQNDNDVVVNLTDGTLILQDADGNEIGKTEYLGTTGSTYLEPGEATFVSIYADVNEGAVVDGYTANLTTSLSSYRTPDTSLDVADAQLRVEEEYGTSYYTAVSVTNTTDKPMARINTVVAVRDSEGKLIDIISDGLYRNELGAGSTITLVDSLDSRAVDYCTNNNGTPAQVEALAWIPAE